MTNKVHDTHLMLLVFLDLEKVGDLSLIKFCQTKQLTPISNILIFNALNYFEVDNSFMWYSQMHTL